MFNGITFVAVFSHVLKNFKGCRLFREGDFLREENHSLYLLFCDTCHKIWHVLSELNLSELSVPEKIQWNMALRHMLVY